VAKTYRLKVRSMQESTGVTRADAWSYDATSKVGVEDKQGAAFTIVVAGLKGYP
jgi:hypothetical protein